MLNRRLLIKNNTSPFFFWMNKWWNLTSNWYQIRTSKELSSNYHWFLIYRITTNTSNTKKPPILFPGVIYEPFKKLLVFILDNHTMRADFETTPTYIPNIMISAFIIWWIYIFVSTIISFWKWRFNRFWLSWNGHSK